MTSSFSLAMFHLFAYFQRVKEEARKHWFPVLTSIELASADERKKKNARALHSPPVLAALALPGLPLALKNSKKPAKPLKREHRVVKVYEHPDSELPVRPRTARLQPERPAPLLNLPELPSWSQPEPKKERSKGFGRAWLDNGRTWLAQIRPPWKEKSKDTGLRIPPPTPESAKFINDRSARRYGFAGPSKSPKIWGDDYEAYMSGEEEVHDPPPLYTKHAPEGGIRGWTTVAGAFLIQFCTIGYLFTWNVFEDHYNHVFLTDENPMVVRFIGSVQWFLAFLLSLVAGKLADSGFFQYSVLSGSLLFSVSLFLLSFVNEEEFGLVFACQSIGMGIGMGLVFVPTATVALHYFKRKRGLAVGIVMSGGSFGGMIFPPILRGMIPERGLGGAVRVTGYIILGCLVIANCLLVTPPKEEKPLYPLPRLDLAKYSKEKEYLFSAGGMFLSMLVIYYPGIIGRAGLGFASDIVGVWNLLIPVSGGVALMLFTTCAMYVLFPPPFPRSSTTLQGTKSLVAASFFYGVFSGAWLSLMVTALSSLASRMSEVGTRVGLILSISSFGALLSALMQDGMLTANRLWVVPSVVYGFVFLGVTALAYFSRMSVGNQIAYGKRKRFKGIPIQLV
ncbi:hypothetical protein NLJ89_g7252 [Agrocybe chaxingu]|uniref:Uncharacterized protein n=1 Tax=Agrocybe chaxingu TaxID=84603 RepID=A0A9W8MTV8_9AGAR|nr:hypothetical protein NLJ89_g7252 [Agrocybe chaxingu]